jgi:hypothetical protein
LGRGPGDIPRQDDHEIGVSPSVPERPAGFFIAVKEDEWRIT